MAIDGCSGMKVIQNGDLKDLLLSYTIYSNGLRETEFFNYLFQYGHFIKYKLIKSRPAYLNSKVRRSAN